VQFRNGHADYCYHPELLVNGGGSICVINRMDEDRCGEGGKYFEAKEAGE